MEHHFKWAIENANKDQGADISHVEIVTCILTRINLFIASHS